MADPVLSARLDQLEQSLNRLPDYKRLWACFPLDDYPSMEAVRGGLDGAIKDQVIEWADSLETSRTKLREAAETQDAATKKELLEEAWQHYTEVYQQSQVFISEFLEIVGGLAFRAMEMDPTIYRFADELTRHCAEISGPGWVAPTMPVLSETLVKTLARVIGHRFPGWTIWNLPLTAHELGHVLVQDDEELRPSLDEPAEYLDELVADAFATCSMGPAYAWAVVLLAFNPLTAHLDPEAAPADAKRAHVIFKMLEKMSAKGNDVYRTEIDVLNREWEDMRDRIGQPKELDKDDKDGLEKLVDDIEKALNGRLFKLHPLARYPHEKPDQGWKLAKQWAECWRTALDNEDELAINSKDIPGESSLRDVVNAAWLCRTDRPNEVAKIDAAAHKLFEAVIKVAEETKKRQQLRRTR